MLRVEIFLKRQKPSFEKFEFLAQAEVRPEVTEGAGFMSGAAAHHQGEIKSSCLHFRDLVHRPYTVYVKSTTSDSDGGHPSTRTCK